MTASHRSMVSLCLGLVTAVTLAMPAKAQDADRYPSKKIDFIVAFAPGGFADTLARFVAQKLSERWNQSIVVENRAGAGGNTAARAVALAEPDGFTVLVTTTAIAINQTMYRKQEFSLDQLAPIAISASSPETIATHPDKVKGGLDSFIAWARDREITFATAGVGSGSHLAAEYFLKVHAKLRAVHVPFRGGAPAIAAVLGDQVDLVASSFGVTSQVNEGKLNGLAVASAARNPAMPQVPTYTEAGYPFEAESWVGFFVPAKTDPAIVAKLNSVINDIVADSAAKEHLGKLGFQISPRATADGKSYLNSEVEKWGAMVRTLGVYAD